MAVDPATSLNSTVTVLRTSADGAAASGVPQNPHNRKRGGFSSPQAGQMSTL